VRPAKARRNRRLILVVGYSFQSRHHTSRRMSRDLSRSISRPTLSGGGNGRPPTTWGAPSQVSGTFAVISQRWVSADFGTPIRVSSATSEGTMIPIGKLDTRSFKARRGQCQGVCDARSILGRLAIHFFDHQPTAAGYTAIIRCEENQAESAASRGWYDSCWQVIDLGFAKRLHTMSEVAVLLLTAVCMRANVIYEFTGTGTAIPSIPLPAEPVAFQLTSSSFINAPFSNTTFLAFSCEQLDSSTNCEDTPQGAVFFVNYDGFAIVDFAASNDSTYVFFFPAGAFTTPGTYSAYVGGPTYNVGTLIVTPEPATTLLAFGGLILCGVGKLLTKRSTNIWSASGRSLMAHRPGDGR
jgi:hypothetical protein